MKIEEALNYADQWSEGQTFYEGSQGWRVVCATLAAEVRRLRENMAQLLTGLECRNIETDVNENTPDSFRLVGELIAHRAKQNTDYAPIQIDVCNMEYMGNSVGYIYQKMEAYRHQLAELQKPAALDDDTRATPIAEIIDEVQALKIDDYYASVYPRQGAFNMAIDQVIVLLERYR